MSVRCMTRVWDLELPDSDKIVLLALADCANDEGHCWPSVASLVKKCSKSERTVQASIKRLVEEGLLVRREVPGKGCNYTVLPQRVRPAENAPPQGTTDTPAAAADKPSRTINSGDKSPSDQLFDAWDAMAKPLGLPTIRVRDASRKQLARLRIKSVGLEAMLEAVGIVGRSDWLNGKTRVGNWRPTIDFLLQPESLRKVLEGAYGGVEGKTVDPATMDWEAQAKFFESINQPDDAERCRRRAQEVALLVQRAAVARAA